MFIRTFARGQVDPEMRGSRIKTIPTKELLRIAKLVKDAARTSNPWSRLLVKKNADDAQTLRTNQDIANQLTRLNTKGNKNRNKNKNKAMKAANPMKAMKAMKADKNK